MAKTFLYFLAIALLINFGIKGALFISYHKTEGTVADLEALTSISYSNQDPFITDAIAPVISYTIDGVGYTMAKSRWGFWTSYNVNEKVTVLYTDPDHPEINCFFPYWLRLGDMYWIFGGAVLGTILTETVQFYKNQKKGS